MKKARFWAIFMTGLLVFSTLTNDYIVANAEDLDGIAETPVEEPVQYGADEGYAMTVEAVPSENTEAAGETVFDGFVDMFTGGGTEGGTEEFYPEGGVAEGYAEGFTDGSEGYVEGTEGFAEGGEEYTEGGEEYIEGGEEVLEEEVAEEVEEEVEEEEEELSEEELAALLAETAVEEVTYPAKDFGSFSAGGMRVSIKAPEGAFPEGTEVSVTPVTYSESDLASLVAEGSEIVAIAAADITFTYKGEEIQPKTNIDVRFSGFGGNGDELTIFHDDGNGLDVVTTTETTSSVEVSVGEFSTYGGIVTAASAAPTVPEAGSTDTGTGSGNTPTLLSKDNGYKVVYSCGNDLLRGDNGSVYAYKLNANNEGIVGTYKPAELNSLIADYGSVFQNKLDKFSGYSIEWNSYQWTSAKEVHINGTLVGPYKVQWIDIDDNNKLLDEKDFTGKFNYDNGFKVTVPASYLAYGDYTYVGPSSVSMSPNYDASKNVITLMFSKNEAVTDGDVIVSGQNYKGSTRTISFSCGDDKLRATGGAVKAYQVGKTGTYTPDNLESYIVSVPSEFTNERNMFSSEYSVRWDSYQWTDKNTIHINGTLIGPYTVRWVDVDNNNAEIKTAVTRTGEFNYASGFSVTVSDDDKSIDGWEFKGADNLKLKPNYDASQNIITLKFSRNEKFKYTVQWIDLAKVDDENGGVFNTEERDGSKTLGTTVSATYNDKNIRGYKYESAEPEDAKIQLTGDPDQDVIKLYFRKNAQYTVKFYYEDENGEYVEHPDAEQTFDGVWGKSAEYKATKTPKVDGIQYSLNTEKSILSLDALTGDPEKDVLKVYYSRPAFKYRVNIFLEKDDRSGYKATPTSYKDYEGIQGVDLVVDPEAEITRDAVKGVRISKFTLDTELSNTTIPASQIKYSTNPKDNSINLYYKGTNNVVYFSILYPGEGVVTVDRQADYRFYPTRVNGKGYWVGTADPLPDGEWSIYNWDGIGRGTNLPYNIKMNSGVPEQMQAYLDSAYPGMNLTLNDIVWYNYKNDEKHFGADWYVNGYVKVPETQSLVTYYKNNGTDDKYEHKDFIGATYKILGSQGDDAFPLTQWAGHRFLGWSEDPTATTATYQPGNSIPMDKALQLYAVWEVDISGKLTITAPSDSRLYDGTPLTLKAMTPEKGLRVEGSELPEGISASDLEVIPVYDDASTITDVGEQDNTIKSVTIKYNGQDITDQLGTDNITLVAGKLTILPIELKVTTGSAEKEYDGTALTKDDATLSILSDDVEKLPDEISVKATGTITLAGETPNTYDMIWDGANENNYKVAEEDLGTLKVTTSDEPTPDNPTPDNPTPVNPTPVNPTPVNPTPVNPTPDNPAPVITPEPETVTTTAEEVVPVANVAQTVQAAETTTIPDEEVPLAGVLGAQRGIEADDSSVLGQRRAAAEAGVLGARRDAETSDANHMAMYLMLMGIATGVGGAYTLSRRKKHEN
ncbi:hypothetical protein SAMN02910292_00606 [Lachnospiraceae bacterium XBB2008]|nr:hypothetical protein SAMN02910292_00606 [Lachnospiraceae bacterium XBB2008]